MMVSSFVQSPPAHTLFSGLQSGPDSCLAYSVVCGVQLDFQVGVLSLEDVLKAVRLRLSSSTDSELRSIACELHEGKLLLLGQVSSYAQKQFAQELVRPLASKLRIMNSVTVVRSERN